MWIPAELKLVIRTSHTTARLCLEQVRKVPFKLSLITLAFIYSGENPLCNSKLFALSSRAKKYGKQDQRPEARAPLLSSWKKKTRLVTCTWSQAMPRWWEEACREQLICELVHQGAQTQLSSMLSWRKALADHRNQLLFPTGSRELPNSQHTPADWISQLHGTGAVFAVQAPWRMAFEFLSSVTGLEICFNSALK